ncbi:xaa-Pro aminopeptidase ApepP-like [Epargyreus clarus]|uniref:xaa-Pro aminopeptidase ApepP-like n=1 Tax=Epargyreus clarus TaxID=520877 RepID=UPI003C2B19FE
MAAENNVPLFLIILVFLSWTANGHLPSYSIDEWAEPNAYEPSPSEFTRLTKQQALDRVRSMREVLNDYGVDAYVAPTADAHNSQYIAPSDARREWLSGLSGSSGTAVVTATHALVWTDPRYFTQFYLQVDTTVWSLMRQGTDLSIQDWLAANLPSGSVVAIDPTTYTRNMWTQLETALNRANVTLQPISDNLVDEARRRMGDPAPARPNEPLIAFTVDFHGRISRDKINELTTNINSRGASALILTALDDIAYTLNLRGSDIPFNPVFFAYLIIRTDLPTRNIILFWGNGVLPSNIVQHLALEGTEVDIRPYVQIFDYLRSMTAELAGKTIWLPQDASHAIHLAAEAGGTTNTLSTLSPVALMKCVKNEVELRGFRSAHIKDGTAVVRFLRWVHEEVAAGHNVTEVNASDKLQELRGEERDFMGPSFATIAGAGENGAIIHYKPSRDGPQRVITKDDMLLVDSGGQYKDGTTDITRTRHMGTPTAKQVLAFTRVLKGQILLGTAVFPRGSPGNVLETLARKSLWDVGLNYAHGTGHGVGHFLNVHEGPSGILSSPMANDPGIVPGMIFSNEPGFYEVGEYGIRHEDLVEVIEMNNTANHVMAEGLVGNFDGRGAVGFHYISLAPQQTSTLDISLLTDFEIKFLNDYHARVLATLGPILLERNLKEDYAWLEKECAPIVRSGTIIITSTPIIAFISVIALIFNM